MTKSSGTILAGESRPEGRGAGMAPRSGYQLGFYTTMGRRTHGKPSKDWLIALAREIGIPGVTVFAGTEGYGHDKRLHAAHFFELADEPIVVTMVVTEEQKERLFARLNAEECDLFYTAYPVMFGTIGKAARAVPAP